MDEFDKILKDIEILNAENNGIIAMYNGDDSCMRIIKD